MKIKIRFLAALFIVASMWPVLYLQPGQSSHPPGPPSNSQNSRHTLSYISSKFTPAVHLNSLSSNGQVTSQSGNSPAYPERRVSDDTFKVGNDTYPLRQYRALALPNDPAASQWWVTQTGLPAAWDHGNGANTKIAIIDTGFALQHEEFTGRWLDNVAESGPAASNGIDDDGNGYVDDFRGWDFDSDDASVLPGETNTAGESAWHGTAVTGVAAATGNNGVGMAGVSWGAKILPLQALNDNGLGNTLSIARAIRYAADRRVDVINLSLGSDAEDSYMRQAIQYALERDVIVVAAAGNDGCNCMSYPARYPEVVAVGASNSSGEVASFSSFGDNLDLVAPGSAMRSASWGPSQPFNAYAPNVAGTSFAAPYVSGLLANSRAKQPAATWGQLVHALLQTSDHRGLTPVTPRSTNMGFGHAKADAFISRAALSYVQPIRYSFRLDARDTLGISLASECAAGQFPTAPFYEIRQGSTVYYTVSDLTVLLQRRAGATVVQKGYACTGLPHDQVTTQLRIIDPALEFLNVFNKAS